MRKLKYHEQKLLKKVDLYSWKSERSHHEVQVMRRYHIQNREDYDKYNKLCGNITQVVAKTKLLNEKDPARIQITRSLLRKLYEMGVIPTEQRLELCEKIPVSAFCRRRLPVVMVRLKMAQTLKEAVTYIEQGHIKVGVETVTDPAFFVTRSMEDFITWQKDSKIRQKLSLIHICRCRRAI
eukprot:TRINITY_DN6970_c0_g1_i7.p2 TRINITY_DN6970_c0_g1~~TRINITY_DN6970_c0_g1_i7.p2  ORF type:complete len:181 (-),score=46.65 TRINITY_DN6970_c0_g1_i7:52-594(-)